jgi:hypothetical protein
MYIDPEGFPRSTRVVEQAFHKLFDLLEIASPGTTFPFLEVETENGLVLVNIIIKPPDQKKETDDVEDTTHTP